jgi:NADP-dependent 3-hydroxy acid dehydrogenase YdfG
MKKQIVLIAGGGAHEAATIANNYLAKGYLVFYANKDKAAIHALKVSTNTQNGQLITLNKDLGHEATANIVISILKDIYGQIDRVENLAGNAAFAMRQAA